MMKQFIKKYSLIVFGTALTSFAISCFYLPNKIVNGGLSGISTTLYHTLGIEPGISHILINGLLLLLALIFIGKSFVAKTLFGVALISGLVQVFSYLPPVTDDIFIATVIGAALYGIGIGLVFVGGVTTGGTDIVGRLFQQIFPSAKIGNLLICIDGCVVFVSLLLFKNINLALYGILTIFISGVAINKVISVMNVSKLAFVVTDKGEDVSKLLVSTSPRGVTILDAVGAYTMENKQVLMCALKESELPPFQKKILSIDKDAFIIFSESQQILGNGFRLYK